MARLFLLCGLFSAYFFATKSVFGSTAQERLELGWRKAQKAIEVVLWYEHVKNVYPYRNESIIYRYAGRPEFQVDDALSRSGGIEQQMTWFPKWFEQETRPGLDNEYGKCYELLQEQVDKPTVDEGEALNDAATGTDYSLKGFSHCLIHTLRERHGDKAVEAVKNERSVKIKGWKESIFDRENEHRLLHGVEPLQLDEELDKSAETWAKQMAKDCKMYHSESTDPLRRYKGGIMGESIGAFSHPDFKGASEPPPMGSVRDPAVDAMLHANYCYDEIRFYPFPEGYTKDLFQDMENFSKFAHFTQTVWKDTKLVGFGIAWNGSCENNQFYLAAHYFPFGNMNFNFVDNVLPPKK